MVNPPTPAAALVLIAVMLPISACGSNAPAGSASSGRGAAAHQALKFSACMRSNGVSDFPDPGAGKFTIDGVVNGSSLNPSAPAFKHALSACKDLEPPGFTGPKVTAQQRTVRLRFAACVRANGVPDFPDPTPNGPLIDTNRIPSAATAAGISALHLAMHKCADYAAELGVRAGAHG